MSGSVAVVMYLIILYAFLVIVTGIVYMAGIKPPINPMVLALAVGIAAAPAAIVVFFQHPNGALLGVLWTIVAAIGIVGAAIIAELNRRK